MLGPLKPTCTLILCIIVAAIFSTGCDPEEPQQTCNVELVCKSEQHMIVESRAECDEGDAECYSVSACSENIWCTGPKEFDCKAEVTCPAGKKPVQTCGDGQDCETVTKCGSTLICVPESQICNEVPTCDVEDTQLDSDECPQDQECYTREACDQTITCMKSVACLPLPKCNDNDIILPANTDCLEGDGCTKLESCGYNIECAPMSQTPCPAYPACKGTDKALISGKACPPDRTCYNVSACDYEITCIEQQEDE